MKTLLKINFTESTAFSFKRVLQPIPTAVPNFMTKSRSSLIRLSNEVSFVSESFVAPLHGSKYFDQNLLYGDICPPVYKEKSVRPLNQGDFV